MTDFEKIQSIAKGDRQVFHKLYEEFNKRVFNTVLSILQNREEAEEILQDVFVELHQSASSFKGESSISTWVYRIAVNKSLDQLRFRKRKKRAAFFTSLFSSDSKESIFNLVDFDHPGVLLENKEKATLLFKAIEHLADQQKTAFVLSQIEELSQKEISEIMKLSPKSVESLIQRAKANLRKNLQNLAPSRRKYKS